MLLYLSSQRIKLRNTILQILAQVVHTEGLKLLSPSSNYEESSKAFIRDMKIFNVLLQHDPDNESGPDVRLRSDSGTARQTRSSSFYIQFKTEPENIAAILMELDSLWGIVNSWMSILQNEIESKEDESCSSPEHILDSDTSSLHSIASHLKRNNFHRQVSRHSASLDMLRMNQPAVEFLSQSSVIDEQAWSRSSSYHNAIEATSDEFERTLSPDSIQSTSSEEQSEVGDNNSEGVSKREDTILELQIKMKDSHVVELTADRLCAVIHGYFLYSQAHPIWGKK